jgi:hypothetical protein
MTRSPVSRWLAFLALAWLPHRPRELRRGDSRLISNPKDQSR